MTLFEKIADPQLTGDQSFPMTLFEKIAKSTRYTEDGCYTAKSSSFFTDILGDTLPSPYSEEANRAMSRYVETRWSGELASAWSDSLLVMEELAPKKAFKIEEEAFAAYMAHYGVGSESLLNSSVVSGDEERLPAPHTAEAQAREGLSAREKSRRHRGHWQLTYVENYVNQVEKAKAARESSTAREEEKAKVTHQSSPAHEEEKAKVVHESSPVHEEETSSSQGLKERPQS